MPKICGKHSCFVYINPALRTSNGRNTYILLFDHFLGPNNVGNMASAAETKLNGTLYNGEKKILTWETYVRIKIEQHSVLNGLKDYSYAIIDDSSKVRPLLKGINTAELHFCKTQLMASPYISDDFASTVELYSTFIKKMKAENPQRKVSEVSFACGKGGKSSFEKGGSYVISNVSNTAVDDPFFDKHEYHALTPERKNTLRLKRLTRGNVGDGHGGSVNGNGKGNSKGPTLKSLNCSIAVLAAKFDKINFPNNNDDDDDDDASSEEDEGTSKLSNAALICQSTKKKCVGN
jgi:hypothetical protein